MDLVQVDVVRLQAFQAALDGFVNMPCGDPGAVVYPVEAPARPSNLRCDHPFVARLQLEPVAYISFCLSLRLALRRHGIRLRCVDEV